MTTLPSLIEKLQFMAQEPNFSSVHIASMISVTERIYEELYALKEDNVKMSTASIPVQNVNTIAALDVLQNKDASIPTDTDLNDEMEAFFGNGVTINDDLVQNLSTATIENNEEDTVVESTFANEGMEEIVKHVSTTEAPIAQSGISFEFPPQPIVHKHTHIEEHQANHNLAEKEEPIIPSLLADTDDLLEEAIAAEKEVVQETQLGQGFKSPTVPNQKDFRTQIGFNDRYLFLNELFSNNKELFDSSIAKINNTNKLEEAKDWIRQELAANLNWPKDDATVDSFYALVDKYFTTT